MNRYYDAACDLCKRRGIDPEEKVVAPSPTRGNAVLTVAVFEPAWKSAARELEHMVELLELIREHDL